MLVSSKRSPSKQENPIEHIEINDNELDTKEDAQENSVDLETEETDDNIEAETTDDNSDSTYTDKESYLDYAIIYTNNVFSLVLELTEYMGEMAEDLAAIKSESFIERYTTTLNSLEETLDNIENLVVPEGYQHMQDNLLKFVESYRKINKESPEDVSQLTVEHLRKMVDAMEEGSQYHEKFMADAMKEIEK